MARVLLLTNSMGASAEVLPALGLLSHQVRVSPAEASALIDSPDFELLFVDARRDLPGAVPLPQPPAPRPSAVVISPQRHRVRGGRQLLSADSMDWDSIHSIW